MTFEDWFKEKYKSTYDNPNMKEINDYCREFTSEIWNAAIEAATTKLVRGTNLYNISGDHITGQIIDSLEQLKTS